MSEKQIPFGNDRQEDRSNDEGEAREADSLWE